MFKDKDLSQGINAVPLVGSEEDEKELTDSLNAFFGKLSNLISEEKKKPNMFPSMIHGAVLDPNSGLTRKGYKDANIGKFVSIRPCAEEYLDRTYLGIYLGDMATGFELTKVTDEINLDKELIQIGFGHYNPAIFVPDLKKIIFGNASWWTIVTSPEILRKITDKDIDDTWYVKMAREMFKNETGIPKGPDGGTV